MTRTNPPARPSATRTPVAGPTTTRPEPTRTAAAAPAVVLRRGATTAKLVALTFDAGSDAGSTDAILQTLARDRIRATFGLTGAWVRANPALARRVVADGHLVVNHTDRHLSFTGASTGTPPLTRSQRLAALRAADDALRAVVGRGFGPWFRPPYGDRDPSVDIDVGLAGYRYDLMWTVDTLGWRGEPPAGVVRRVMAALVPGAIVLMHVGSGSTDAAALPELVRQLRASGYGFVRADRF